MNKVDSQVFTLRQVAEKTIEKPRVTCTHFSMFSIKPTVRAVAFLLKSY